MNALTPNTVNYFHTLGVFPKHCHISTEILCDLWDKSTYEVRRIMKQFEDKSLVVSFFPVENTSGNTHYVYSIHTLVFKYLKQACVIPDMMKYHSKLLEKYKSSVVQSEITDSAVKYMLAYYGFHAKHVDIVSYFDIYFDLRFIENKIRYIGSSDLLSDFKIYKEYITKNVIF